MELFNFIVHAVFWLLGFLILFRISYCTRRKSNNNIACSVSIIIPARNEEKTLPILLSSIRQQNFTADEIIVVVDHSADRTSDIAKKEGATVILSEPLLGSWMGKSWACYQGAQASSGEVLVFLDADTYLEPGGLQAILEAYLERGGVISVQPYHRMRKLYEQFSAFFNLVAMAAMGSFTILGYRRKPIGLFGPCIVMNRQHYFTSGGHADVKGELVEDLALGEKIKQQKMPIYNYGGKGAISFRMYPGGIGELVEGWSKNFATGAVKTPLLLLVTIIAWLGGGWGSAIYLTEAIIKANYFMIILWAALYLIYIVQIYWMLVRIGTFKWYSAFFHPIFSLFFLVVFLRSIILIYIQKNVKWKGRTINLSKGPHKP